MLGQLHFSQNLSNFLVYSFLSRCIKNMWGLGTHKSKKIDCKLMRLGVTNRIVVVESNLKSKFDHQFRSNSKSNDFDLNLIIFSLKSIYFNIVWLKSIYFDLFSIKKDRLTVNYLIEKADFNPKWSKTTGFLTFLNKFEPFLIKFKLFFDID